MTVILGIDPGARETGFVVLANGVIERHGVITRETKLAGFGWLPYIRELVGLVGSRANPLDVAMEEYVIPRGFAGGERRFVSPVDIAGTSRIVGVLEGACVTYGLSYVVVRPPNGKRPLSEYPRELVGPQERTGTSGKRRHERSAYDVAVKGGVIFG